MARSKSLETQTILRLAKETLENEPGISLRRVHYLLCSNGEAKQIGYVNSKKQYDSLSKICTDARKSGDLEYSLFSDSTRAIHRSVNWNNLADFSEAVSKWYERSRWQDQGCYCELLYEKDGLTPVLREVAAQWQMTHRSLHGTASSTCCWKIAETFAEVPYDKPIHVLYFGDFDCAGEMIPSAMLSHVKDILEKKFNTYRDINFHLLGFRHEDFEVCSIESIEGKEDDKLLPAFIEKYGEARFAEVDALPREILISRVNEKMRELVDLKKWEAHAEVEAIEKKQILQMLQG